MTDRDNRGERERKGYIPDGHDYRGGYVPERGDGGPPPSGGSGGSGDKDKDDD